MGFVAPFLKQTDKPRDLKDKMIIKQTTILIIIGDKKKRQDLYIIAVRKRILYYQNHSERLLYII